MGYLQVGDEQVSIAQVVDFLNDFQHLVAPNLKRKKCGPSQRITKLKLKRKVVSKDDTGGSLENLVTLF